ncbi:glycoside hydrolase family 2 TIM barrel-domain containing protein, partial [Mycoplasmopsis alligatoris]
MKKKIILGIVSTLTISTSIIAIACNKNTSKKEDKNEVISPTEKENGTNNKNTLKSPRQDIKEEKLDFSQRNIKLMDNWKFFYGNKDKAELNNFDDSTFSNLNLPHDYSLGLDYDLKKGEAESGFKLGNIGWYRKEIFIPLELKNKRIRLNFGGVYNNAEVFVNGKKIGFHPYGYTPFAFDITSFVEFNKSNLIAVKVNHKFPSSRWYSGSGIYRDVSLSIFDQVHIDKYGVNIQAQNLKENFNKEVTLKIKTNLVNNTKEAKKLKIVHELFDKDNKLVTKFEGNSNVTNALNSVFESELKVNKPQLWDLNSPVLYKLKTQVFVDNKLLDSEENDYGFRFFEFDKDKGFLLNGKNIKLKGVSMHHDQGSLGAASFYDATLRQVEILKEMGTNTIRVTHNPASDTLIDIANKKGMLVIDEAFDTWLRPKNGNWNDYSAFFDKVIEKDNPIIGKESENMTWAELDTKTMVKRGQNSPAIIMWSVGNELLEGQDGSRNKEYEKVMENMMNWIKSIDPTRPATFGDNHLKNNNGLSIALAKIIDKHGGIVGFNYAKNGTFDDYKKRFPDWKIYAAETSSAVNSRGVYNANYRTEGYNDIQNADYLLTGYDRSKVGWGDTSAQSWDYVIKRDFVAGEMIWTGFDYLGEPTPWNGVGAGTNRQNHPKSSYFGIVDTAGLPKDRYYFYRSQWNDSDTTLHVLPEWKESMIKKDNDQKVDVVVYTNAHKVKLFKVVNGKEEDLNLEKSFTETKTKAGFTNRYYTGPDKSNKDFENLFFTFKVPFFEGKLVAKAYDKEGKLIEKTVGRKSVETFSEAKKMDLNLSKKELNANNQDLLYVEVSI